MSPYQSTRGPSTTSGNIHRHASSSTHSLNVNAAVFEPAVEEPAPQPADCKSANSYQTPEARPPSPTNSRDKNLPSYLCSEGEGSAQGTAPTLVKRNLSPGSVIYTRTPYRAGINLRDLPVISTQLPPKDARMLTFRRYQDQILDKVDMILDAYKYPRERFIQLCGRRPALRSWDHPTPTILITVKPDLIDLQLDLALHHILMMAYQDFCLHGVAVEVIHPDFEDPEERNGHGPSMQPPLPLMVRLIHNLEFHWAPKNLKLSYIPPQLRESLN